MSKSRPAIRLLTAVPVCDGHDSTINTLNLEFVRAGMEVIYLGFHRPARDIVRAAIQEDVRAIGISSYNGGHVEFFREVVDGLRKHGAGDIGVFGGGGGTITPDDAKVMSKKGVDRIFFAGTPLDEITRFVTTQYGRDRKRKSRDPVAWAPRPRSKKTNAKGSHLPRVIGVTGSGGAGKTTLLDELVLRILKSDPNSRIAILSHDPSIVSNGALLGDRAAMIYSQDDRVFMRSLATRGRAGGLAPDTSRYLRTLRAMDFDWILVETVGTGQEAMPFTNGLVDRSILVMSPDYGARLQLQKIAMLDAADIVVVNKSDLAGAKTAAAEIEQRLSHRGENGKQQIVSTVAKRHGDSGVDELFRLLSA